MPNRIIREGWIESPRIDQLTPLAERFFLRLCLRADDFGRYHATPQLLKSNLFPLREDVKTAQIEGWLGECVGVGLLTRYEHDGKAFLEIPRFEQRMRAAKSKFPTPPTDVRHMTVICQTEDRPPLSEAETESETRSGDGSPQGSVTAADIYACYPRKVGRDDALKAIARAMKSISPEVLEERTKDYFDCMMLWPESDRRFIPYPATWFNRGSYNDDPKEWTRKPGEHGNAKRAGFA